MRRSVVRSLGPLCGPNTSFVLVAVRIAVLGALRAPKQTLPAVLALLTASAMTILSAQQSGDRPAGNIRGTRSAVLARNGLIATSQPSCVLGTGVIRAFSIRNGA